MDKDYIDGNHIKLYKTPKSWGFGATLEFVDDGLDDIKSYILTLTIYFGPFTLELIS